MIRMPLASASLLAIAIALAGCGEKDDKAAAPQAQAQAPAAASTTAAAPGAVDEAAGKAVVQHYADMVYAVYSDSLSTAKALQTAILDAFLAKPNDETPESRQGRLGRLARTLPAERSLPLWQHHHRRLGRPS